MAIYQPTSDRLARMVIADMGRDDWFRNKKWDAATQAHFNEKLRRARDKAQPLRIQASYLENIDPKAHWLFSIDISHSEIISTLLRLF
jgi:hypothetical protein